MNRGRYPRHIIEMALRIHDEDGVGDPKQVADLISEETNDGYTPSEKTVRLWFKKYSLPLASDLQRLRSLAELDRLPLDFKEVALVRRHGEWSQEIKLLRRDNAGVLVPMAPCVYRDSEQYREESNAMTAEWSLAVGGKPKYNLLMMLTRYLMGDSYRKIAEAYVRAEGKRISASTVRRLLKCVRLELPHGRGPHHPPKKTP